MSKSRDNSKILVCDDSVTNTLLLEAMLKDEGYDEVTAITDPQNVNVELSSGNYQLLLLDIEMPKLNGFEVMERIRQEQVVDEFFPIIILTGSQDATTRNKALAQGATDFINKPFDQEEVLLRIHNTLRFYGAYSATSQNSSRLESLVEARTQDLNRAADVLIAKLAKAGELKDDETGQHVLRVGRYARLLAELIDLPANVCFMLEKAAPLHDLGKIGIPDSILLKPGKLNEEEWILMKQHTIIGASLLDDHYSVLVKMASTIALTHHEWWDGGGYPNELRGESIPIEGRITAICDVFDALTSDRPYKKAWSAADTIKEIQGLSGRQFDPRLTDAFLANVDQFLAIKAEHGDMYRPQIQH